MRDGSIRFLLVATCLMGAVGWPQPAHAQEGDSAGQTDYVEPNERQRDLNNQAVRAIVRDDPATAVPLLEESLAVGKLNVTYLNLGRAYQQLENCQRAREALEASKSAPPVEEPSPEIIRKKADQYLEELEEQCPDEPDEESELTQTEDETTAAEESREQASEQSSPDRQSEQEQGDEPSEVDSSDHGSEPPSAQRADVDERDATASKPSANRGEESAEHSTFPWGWTAIGGGIAAGGGSLALHLIAESQRDIVREASENNAGVTTSVTRAESLEIRRRANRIDTWSLVTAGVAVAAVGTGTVVLLTDAKASSDRDLAYSLATSGDSLIFRIQF